MLPEEDIRKKVKTLKKFYLDVINFVLMNIILALVWVTFDKTGTFWPKYVILIWGIFLILKAARMGVLPLIFHRVSFFNQDWEEKKVKELLHRRNTQRKRPFDKNEKDK